MGYLPIAYVAMVSVPVDVLLHTPPIGAVHTWVNTCGVTVASALGFPSLRLNDMVHTVWHYLRCCVSSAGCVNHMCIGSL